MAERKVVWQGPVTERCETCETELKNVFYDAVTKHGPWAIMCPSCHNLGPGLGKVGSGVGQKFERQPDGSFVKTEG